ncbi:TetR/AcrR family transcriptional regulator [Metaclostridioides mangenotii]|uniref:TetR/AcrR family transcriptional regulator n=1 Tax=Metaclostridioides mangenotii TaxID=1540 RepID=UPI000485A671|nr:TetR/AcrR family transcriptional regulator [Clostridioides mangenotii]
MKAQNTKKRIIKASKQIFVDKGLSSVTMTDIVNASGYSRGGVYRYYQKPESVFADLMMEEIKLLKENSVATFNEYLDNEFRELKNIRNTLRLAGYEYMIQFSESAQLGKLIYQSNIELIMKLKKCSEHEANRIFLILEGFTVMALTGILDEDRLEEFLMEFKSET